VKEQKGHFCPDPIPGKELITPEKTGNPARKPYYYQLQNLA
jgi:hypothetical protein